MFVTCYLKSYNSQIPARAISLTSEQRWIYILVGGLRSNANINRIVNLDRGSLDTFSNVKTCLAIILLLCAMHKSENQSWRLPKFVWILRNMQIVATNTTGYVRQRLLIWARHHLNPLFCRSHKRRNTKQILLCAVKNNLAWKMLEIFCDNLRNST